MTDNEVSKLGQPDEPEEVIEGRIVGQYEGPGYDMWGIINEQVRNMYRQGSYHYIVDEDGIHPGQEPEGEWKDVIVAPGGWAVPKEQHYDTGNAYRAGRMFVSTDGTAGDIQYERGPSFTDSWFDEVRDFKFERQTVTTEFAWADISDEAFRLMTGYDKNVLTAAQRLADKTPVPGVDIDAVKWPGPRAKAPERWDWLK